MDLALKLSERYGKGYLSYSSIKCALQDMSLFEMKMRDEIKFNSPALSFGKLYDCLLLTPDSFDGQFVVADDAKMCKEIGGKAPRNTKAYKEWKAEISQLTQNADKTLVSQEDMFKAEQMITRLKETGVHEIALQGDAQYEFNDFIGDVPVRGFLDILGDGYITDSKTTQKLSKFKWSIRDFSYDIQAYIYTEVLGIKDFRWVAQEKTEPYSVALYYASDQTLKQGKMKFDTAVEKIREHLDSGLKASTYYETSYI
tara:strand:+ start:3597 stop:4364 length:768 start_codon:yes stop_codon:yes gene_type:complete